MNTPNTGNLKTEKDSLEYRQLVSSTEIAKRYNVSSRYILKLAAEGTIPCVRIGKKCVRFDAQKVAKEIEG